jgi:hypothetical protein
MSGNWVSSDELGVIMNDFVLRFFLIMPSERVNFQYAVINLVNIPVNTGNAT